MARPRTARVLVVGSINHDHSAHVAALPLPGQTVLASAAFFGLGGKGANQAVAAALAGVNVRLVGAVGDDAAGRRATDELDRHGVDVAAARADDVQVVVTQGELRPATIAAAAALATRTGARLVLNLAPFVALPRAVLDLSDPLVVNEHEAGELLGEPEPETLEQAEAAATRLRALGSRSVVVRLGAHGAIGADGAAVWHQPVAPSDVEPVDTTGARDALTGVLSARLARGDDLRTALRYGVVAASIAVTRPGTTATYPAAVEIAAGVDVAPR